MLDLTVMIAFIFMITAMALYGDALFHEYVRVMGEEQETRRVKGIFERALSGLGELEMAENLFVREVSFQLALA